DVAATGAMDTAVVAIEQGELVAENIKTLLAGGTVLKAYEPAQPFLSIPLGRGAGVTYIPGTGLLDAEPTTEIKGADLLIGKYREIFGMADWPPSAQA